MQEITGHRSRELWRYQHLMPQLREAAVNIVATTCRKPKSDVSLRVSLAHDGTGRNRWITDVTGLTKLLRKR